MKKIILVYGIISGAVIVASMIVGFTVLGSDTEGMQFSEILGYTFMIIALSVIFIGIKKYRDDDLGGVIIFKTAMLLGLGISLVAGAAYVISWEVYLEITDHAFINDYTEHIIKEAKQDGMDGAEFAALVDQMNETKVNYARPMYRIPLTFLEIFPVGLLISLIAAGLLRNPKFLPAH